MPGGVDPPPNTTGPGGGWPPGKWGGGGARGGRGVPPAPAPAPPGGCPGAGGGGPRRPPLEIVPGIEINCDVEGAEIHILGYYVDYEAGWFQDFCRAQREERRARVHRMVARLGELGMPIDPDEVFALVREGSAGRPPL